MAGFPLRTLLVMLGLWCAPALAAPDAVADALAAALQAPVVNCGAAWLDRQRLAPYYAAAETVPLWVSARAQRLRTALQNAGQEGLSPARYRIADIEAHWSATTPVAQACLDLLLTAGFDRYSRDVRRGLTGPQEADPSWQLRPAPRRAACRRHRQRPGQAARIATACTQRVRAPAYRARPLPAAGRTGRLAAVAAGAKTRTRR
jgi:murein L,D-transpeptidase YcbB/YkuD